MTLSQILQLTGNEFRRMNYQELEEVTRAMAEAARKRIMRGPEGPAYAKLKRYATGKGSTKKVAGLHMSGDTVRISQRFKGKNKMSMSDLRNLRKVLFDYLKDETSTKRGLEKFNAEKERKKQEYKEQLKQYEEAKKLSNQEWAMKDKTLGPDWHWEVFDQLVTDTDFIEFGKNHLGWQSQDIKEAIISCGGYGARGFNWFSYLLKDYVYGSTEQEYGPHPEQLDEEMPDFFYED